MCEPPRRQRIPGSSASCARGGVSFVRATGSGASFSSRPWPTCSPPATGCSDHSFPNRTSGGVAAWATITTAFGVGSFLGGILILRRRVARPLVVAVGVGAVWVVPWFLLAIPAPTAVIAAGALLGGVGVMVFNTLWQASIQEHIPRRSLSRVSAYDWLGSLALDPVGVALIGPIAVALGTQSTLLAWPYSPPRSISGPSRFPEFGTFGPGPPSTSRRRSALQGQRSGSKADWRGGETLPLSRREPLFEAGAGKLRARVGQRGAGCVRRGVRVVGSRYQHRLKLLAYLQRLTPAGEERGGRIGETLLLRAGDLG